MRKKIIFLLFVFLIFIFILGCGKKDCKSGLYTRGSECCTYVCNKDCPYGYKEGTCNCECKENIIKGSETNNTNIDGVFEDNRDIEPPSLPMP